jgi:hypothetical protein
VTTSARCSTSDVGREAVYTAEEAALGGTDLDVPRPFATLVDAAAGVTTGSWWRACEGPPVEVVMARRDAASSNARAATGRGVVVRLAAGQLTSLTVAHELAHALAGIARGHDERFRAAHVDVVAMLAGGGQGDALRRSYADHGVPAGGRDWPPPHRHRGRGFVVVP